MLLADLQPDSGVTGGACVPLYGVDRWCCGIPSQVAGCGLLPAQPFLYNLSQAVTDFLLAWPGQTFFLLTDSACSSG